MAVDRDAWKSDIWAKSKNRNISFLPRNTCQYKQARFCDEVTKIGRLVHELAKF